MFFEVCRNRIPPGNVGRPFNEGRFGQPPEITLVQQRLQTNVKDSRRPQWTQRKEGAGWYSVNLGIKVGIERDELASKEPILSPLHARDERANVADRDKHSNCEDETKGECHTLPLPDLVPRRQFRRR